MTSASFVQIKRNRGPANRRTPTRKRYSDSQALDDVIIPPLPRCLSDHELSLASECTEMHNHLYRNMDGLENASVRFLDKVDLERPGSGDGSEASPTPARKPYIPRLDLTTLHQHGDGTGQSTQLHQLTKQSPHWLTKNRTY